MNATIEQEIIEKFESLDPDARERVRVAISEEHPDEFDYRAWREEQLKIRARIKALKGASSITYMDLLRETRGESL